MAITATSTVARAVTRRPNPTTGKPPKRPDAALTPRVKAAIHAMIFKGLRRAEAAADAQLSEIALYNALRKPVVLAYWNEQLKVLRESARARNVHVLEEIRDQSGNDMARVAAIKVLEPPAEQRGGGMSLTLNITPGYVIDLSEETGGPQIDGQAREVPNPLSQQGDVGDEP
jgi:hypothetical protein